MSNIQVFERKYLAAMAHYASLDTHIKELQGIQKAVKKSLESAMREHEIKSIKNDYVNIVYVDESHSTSIDLAKLKSFEPALYAELLKEYPKVTSRKASLRITVNK